MHAKLRADGVNTLGRSNKFLLERSLEILGPVLLLWLFLFSSRERRVWH